MKKLFLILLLAILCFADYFSAWQDVQRDILNNDIDGVEVFVLEVEIDKGSRIDNWRGSHKSPIKGYFFFIDFYPGANWEHPCKYVFANDSIITTIDELAPPYILKDMETLVSTDINYSGIPSAPRTVYSAPRPSRAMDLDDCWAVLISGGGSISSNYARYYNDIVFIYETLIGYGYHDDHIIVLFADGTNPSPDQSGGANSDPDLDDDGDPDIQFSATTANLSNVFSTLSGILTSSDQLFIYSTDHGGGGGIDDWDVYLVGWGENINDDVFAAMLEDIECSSMIITMEQCYSGGFLDDLASDGRIITTACRYDEVSWSGVTHSEYDEFVFHWTSAVNGADPYGSIVDADSNDDDMISMQEAFIYAEENDAASETPQYLSIPEDLGSYTFLFGSIAAGPYILSNGEIWGELHGDGDNIPDPGEIFFMIPKLLNIGIDATNVNLTLSTPSPRIILLDSLIHWPTLAAHDSTAWYSDSFKIRIRPTANYGDFSSFIIDLTESSGYTNTYNSMHTIPKPSLVFANSIINDYSGDDDGFIDPGENVDMVLFIENNGVQEALSLNATISTENPYVTIHENLTSFPDMFPLNELASDMPINLTLSSSAPDFMIIDFSMIITGAFGFIDTLNFSIQATSQYIYPYTENEELWDLSGWHRTYFRQITGDYSWYCGTEGIYRYEDSATKNMISAYPIYLPESPILVYSEFLAMEPGYDHAKIEYSTDGFAWSIISDRTDYNPPWQSHVVDLSEIDAEEIYLKFRLESDGGVHTEGWYLDNISILKNPGRDLLGGHVVEPCGKSGDKFTFRVTWYDSSGNTPANKNIVINGIPYSMVEVAGTAQTGLTYQKEIALYAGDITDFFFQFDGIYHGPFEGPKILSPVFSFDLSSSPESFSHSGEVDEWEWGIPSGSPYYGVPSPGYTWATETSGNYDENLECRLESPSIDISTMTNPHLVINHWYSFNDIESGNVLAGAGNIKFQTSSMSSPQILMPNKGYDCVASVHNYQIGGEDGFGSNDNGNFWHTSVFNLLPITENNFKLIFDTGSRDGYSADLGWYVSDIYIYDAIGLLIDEDQAEKPEKTFITAFPNPFNSSVKLTYSGFIDKNSFKVSIYDSQGRHIESLISQSNTIIWSPGSISSGVYLIKTNEKIASSSYIKVLYIK